jgi:hypothetical protein
MSFGGYVNGSAYRLMRVRMLLTSSSGPSEEYWAEVLGKLWTFLETSEDGQVFLAELQKERDNAADKA